MKASKLFAHKSFLRTCLTYFVLCSLLVFAVNAAVNAAAAARLDRAFPSIDLVLEYEDSLREDDFAAIPLTKMTGFYMPQTIPSKNTSAQRICG